MLDKNDRLNCFITFRVTQKERVQLEALARRIERRPGDMVRIIVRRALHDVETGQWQPTAI